MDVERAGNGNGTQKRPAEVPAPAASQRVEQAQKGQGMAPRVALAVFVALLVPLFTLYAYWLIMAPTLSHAVLRADDWLNVFTQGKGGAVLLVFGPALALLCVVGGVLLHFGMPQVWKSARRSLQVGGLLGACLAAAWFVGTARLAGLKAVDWLFFVPVVPPALLAFQAMIMWRQRPRSVGDFRIGVSAQLCKALSSSEDDKQFKAVHAQLVRVFGGVASTKAPNGTTPATSDGARTPSYFAAQFAVPCLLLLLVGFGAMALATSPTALALAEQNGGVLRAPEAAQRGLQWGVAGAYTYVLFTFGARSFRNDLTVGAATWAIITLVTGPALAVVVALVGNLKPPADTVDWQGAVVLFFAGAAPRRVMSIVESVAQQFLKAPTEATAKLIPLTSLRGISSELALRLREENIEDVTALAYADPIRLVQSMPYDLRQVVEWIDQAQLAVALPRQYETLLERGVTGAIDLAWRWLQACGEDGANPVTIAHGKAIPQSFALLASDPKDAGLIYETARQMFYEEHVRLLWVMYNSFSTTSGDPSPSESSNSPASEPARTDATPLPEGVLS
jgi:hypothetical protein